MKTRLLSLAALVMSLVLTTSCGSDSRSSILEHVPYHADIVVVGNAQTIANSMDASIDDSGITLPAYITDLMSGHEMRAIDEINRNIAESGIKIESFALACVNGDYDHWYGVFELADAEQFISLIESSNNVQRTADDNAIYYDVITYESTDPYAYTLHNYFAIAGSYAYILPEIYTGWHNEFDGMQSLKQFVADAATVPFANTPFAHYITQGNVGGVSVKMPAEANTALREVGLGSLVNGYVCLSADLSGDELTVNGKAYYSTGAGIESTIADRYVNLNERISPEALAYLNSNENLVFACSLKDINLNELLNGAHIDNSARAFIEYLKSIDGTVAVGIGVKNGLRSLADMSYDNGYSDLTGTAVCQLKPGEINGLLRLLRSGLSMAGLNYSETGNGFQLTIPGEDITIYVAGEDDMLIVSTSPISRSSDNEVVRRTDITRYNTAIAAIFTRDDKLMRDLGLTNTDVIAFVGCNPNKLEFVATAQVTGDQRGILANMVKAVITIMQNEDSIERIFRDARRNSRSLYDYGRDWNTYSYEKANLIEEEDVPLLYEEAEEAVEDEY